MKPTEQFNLKQTKVHHTLESTLIEVVCAILLVALWTLMWRRWHATDMLENRLIITVVITVLTIYLLVCAYFPTYLAWSIPLNSIKAVGRVVRAMRYWALTGLTATVVGLAGWGTMRPGLLVFVAFGLVLKAVAVVIEFKKKDKKETPQ